MVNLRITVDFHSDTFSAHMVNSRDNLSKAAFSEDFDDFKSIEDLVLRLQNVVAFFIVFVGYCIGDVCACRDFLRIIHGVMGYF